MCKGWQVNSKIKSMILKHLLEYFLSYPLYQKTLVISYEHLQDRSLRETVFEGQENIRTTTFMESTFA